MSKPEVEFNAIDLRGDVEQGFLGLGAKTLRKRRVDKLLEEAGLVRVYVPRIVGQPRAYMLVSAGEVPKEARRIDSTTYELARWEDME